VKWAVALADKFIPEFDVLAEVVRSEILALARVLQEFGPPLGPPRVDTLKGSRHANMKELQFSAADGEGEWLSILIPRGRPFYSWPGTNPAGSRNALIANADGKPTSVLAPILRGLERESNHACKRK
jgi:hypothetical protein